MLHKLSQSAPTYDTSRPSIRTLIRFVLIASDEAKRAMMLVGRLRLLHSLNGKIEHSAAEQFSHSIRN